MMTQMTSRQRVAAALHFQPVDRVPVDLNLSYHAYLRLCEATGSPPSPLPRPGRTMEVQPDPGLYEQLGVDVYSVKFGGREVFDGTLPETITDTWGISYRLARQDEGALFEFDVHPLAGACLEDLRGYTWPMPPTEAMKASLREEAKRVYEMTELALCGRFGPPIIEVAIGLLGFEEWLTRLLTEPEFTRTLLQKIEAVATAWDQAGIEACGEYLTILKVSGEDFGSQQSLLYSPRTIRECLLPVLRCRWDAVHTALQECGSSARVMLHTCGAVKTIVPDLIAAGIEVLDPIQPKAAGMDPAGLHAAFGGKLAFHGGVDVQEILPNGTPQRVRQHVRDVIAAMDGLAGGYILAPSHIVQADVPPENILAMLEAHHPSTRKEDDENTFGERPVWLRDGRTLRRDDRDGDAGRAGQRHGAEWNRADDPTGRRA